MGFQKEWKRGEGAKCQQALVCVLWLDRGSFSAVLWPASQAVRFSWLQKHLWPWNEHEGSEPSSARPDLPLAPCQPLHKGTGQRHWGAMHLLSGAQGVELLGEGVGGAGVQSGVSAVPVGLRLAGLIYDRAFPRGTGVVVLFVHQCGPVPEPCRGRAGRCEVAAKQLSGWNWDPG